MRKYILVLVLLLVIPLFSYLRYRQEAYIAINGFAQGTTYRVIYRFPFGLKYIIDRRTAYLDEEIDSILLAFDRSLSVYRPESIISRINRDEPGVKVDDLFREVFQKSEQVTLDTDGAFDITVGPLVRAWGFGPEGLEDEENVNVDSLLQYVGMNKVKLEGDTIVKALPGIQLDVNAIAQGYSVDLLSRFLENKGIRNYLVEVGGEINTRGHKQGGLPWSIGVDKPVDNNMIPGEDLQVILHFHDISLATSGNYRKFYEKNGVKYAHSIDPRTGYPARDRLLSVTLTAEDCMTADAYATACMVIGLDKSIRLIESHPNLEGYLIYSDENGAFRVYMTDAFSQYIAEDQEGS